MASAKELWRASLLLRGSQGALLGNGWMTSGVLATARAGAAGPGAEREQQQPQRRRRAPPPASPLASAPWGVPAGARPFFSSAHGGSSSGAGASESGSSSVGGLSGAITAALRGLGAGAAGGGGAGAGGGATDSKSLAEGIERGQAAWAARMRFRRQEPTFQVIECFSNGVARESHTPRTVSQLGLHPRDVVLFAPISRLAAPQRATIAVREGKILFKTEVVQAIISADKAVLIKGRRERDTAHLAAEIIKATGHVGPSAAATEPTGGAAGGAGGPAAAAAAAAAAVLGGGVPGMLPFELRVLEVLLDATVEYFYTKTQHLNWMMESIGDEIRQPRRPFNATDKAHQLIPIQKFLTSIKNDVKETCEALNAMIQDEEHLKELCLTWQRQLQQAAWQQPAAPQVQYSACPETGMMRPAPTASFLNECYDATHPPGTGAITASTNKHTHGHGGHGGHGGGGNGGHGGGPHHHAQHNQMSSAYLRTVSDMLESYEREIRSLEGSLMEAEENLDNTREVWHMQLDSSRNHIILVNLWLSMINISVMATTILPAFFGMNLHSGLPEESMEHFYMVVGVSLAIAVASYPLGRWIYFRHWRKMTQHEMFEQKMLRVLLVQHIDDLDEVLATLLKMEAPVDRRKFRDAVTATLGNRAISAANINFLFDIFDANRTGFLEEAELLRHISHARLGSQGLPTAKAQAAALARAPARGAAAGDGAVLRRAPPGAPDGLAAGSVAGAAVAAAEAAAAAAAAGDVVTSDGVLEAEEAAEQLREEAARDPDEWQEDEKYRWPHQDEL